MSLTLAAENPIRLVERWRELGFVLTDVPSQVQVDGKDVPVGPDWRSAFERARLELSVSWANWLDAVVLRPRGFLAVRRSSVEIEVESFAHALSTLPFTYGACGSMHRDWQNGKLGDRYSPPSFADGHAALGWGCMFRGAGHERLVSRRWIDHGPWWHRVIKAPNDTTFVQFHDLEADAATALDQAREQHRHMGIDLEGGFIQTGYVYRHDLKGRYSPKERELKVVVHGRKVSSIEMTDARVAQLQQKLGPDQPLDAVGFVFIDEAEAREHLEALWLRELRCYAIIGGKEVRLDEDYQPSHTST